MMMIMYSSYVLSRFKHEYMEKKNSGNVLQITHICVHHDDDDARILNNPHTANELLPRILSFSPFSSTNLF